MLAFFRNRAHAAPVLDSFVEQSPIALAEISNTHYIVHANDAFRDLLRISRQEYTNKTILDFFSEQDKTRFAELISQTRDEKPAKGNLPFTLHALDGQEINVSLHVTLMKPNKKQRERL
mgnify:CR=1 FL=1